MSDSGGSAVNRAVVYDKPGTISTKVVELEIPKPGPGELLLRLSYSGVCHSDLAVMLGSWPEFPDPISPEQVGGHEGIGRIVEIGPGNPNSALKKGDRVGVKWIYSICGGCEPCLAGYDGVCFNQKISGLYTPGTFQQYIVAPANYVTPIPDGVDDAAAAPMLCAGVTSYAALKRSNTRGGNWVVIMGAGGGLGNVAVQLAKGAFALRTIGVDLSSKKDFVMQLGAEAFIAVDSERTVSEQVLELTGGLGAHAVLVLTASEAAYADSMHLLRFGGTLVCIGIPSGDARPIKSASAQLLVANALNIVGVSVGNRQEAIECLEFAARNLVKPTVEIRKMEDLTQVFQDMSKNLLKGRVVLDLE